MRMMRKPSILAGIACLLAIAAILSFETPTSAKLAANKLAANKLSPLSAASNSAAASKLAGSRLAIGQSGQDLYSLNAESASGFLASDDGREVLSFVVSCALPVEATVTTTLPDGTRYEFLGELGLAPEWLDHPLKKAGRGWVSACLFARLNNHDVPLPISFRGPQQGLATVPEELANWPLEEGAFYGDYFVAPGEQVQWIACRGRDQAAGETGGLVDRDCTEPDPANPGKTLCGLIYAGDCASPTAPVCDQVSPHDYYRKCRDQAGDDAHSDVFREVITVFAVD